MKNEIHTLDDLFSRNDHYAVRQWSYVCKHRLAPEMAAWKVKPISVSIVHRIGSFELVIPFTQRGRVARWYIFKPKIPIG
jgi:hypothetical protein